MTYEDPSKTGLDQPDGTVHRNWLRSRATALLDFFDQRLTPASLRPGVPQPSDFPRKLYQTGRLVHGFAVASVIGRANSYRHVDRGMDLLWNRFRDPAHGGFFAELQAGCEPYDRKECYGHAFVMLAAASAKAINHPDADRLLGDVAQVLDDHFWDLSTGAARESFSRDWQNDEPYRGQNGNMHLAEAYLAAFEVTGEAVYLRRAESIAELIIDRHARKALWRIPEHFTQDWKPDQAYAGNPEFRPYGTTPGHAFEWSRLLLQMWTLGNRSQHWLPEAAGALFRQAYADGWRQDGGLLYAIGWAGEPVRPERLSWPCCEAIGAAAKLQALALPGGPWSDHYRTICTFVAEHFIDYGSGAWFIRIPEAGPGSFSPQDTPDLYHALQACLLPLVPTDAGLLTSRKVRLTVP